MTLAKNIHRGLCIVLLAVALIQPVSAFGEVMEGFTTPGTTTWTVPAGVYEVTVEAIGGGGAGSSGSGSVGGAGGGGGGYVRGTIAVTPGTQEEIVVGAGGSGSGGTSHFRNSTTLSAGGGASGAAGGSGGSGAGSSATVTRTGGDGAANFGQSGGGGGGAAGSNEDGASGSRTTGGLGGEELGGRGGDGAGGTSLPGDTGELFGAGGGGGSGDGSFMGTGGIGGVGAQGGVRVHYTRQLPNVQRGQAEITGTFDEVIVDIGAVNASRAFVRHNVKSESSAPSYRLVTAELTSSGDQIIFRRNTSLTGATTTIEWEVIEDSRLTVQRGTWSFGGSDTSSSIGINGILLSNTFILVSARMGQFSPENLNQGLWTANYGNSGSGTASIQVEREVSGSEGDLVWQVVTWEGSNVYPLNDLGSASLRRETSVTQEIPASFNPENSFLVFSVRSGDENLEHMNVRGTILNSTHIEFSREEEENQEIDVEWFLVENPSFYVQRGTTMLTTTSSSESFNDAGLENMFHTISWSSSGANTNHNRAAIASSLNNGEITFNKSVTGNTQEISYEIIHIRNNCDKPPFGGWTVSGEHNCVIEDNTNIYQSGFTCSGAGTFTVLGANFTAKSITSTNMCSIIAQSGAQIRAQRLIELNDRSFSGFVGDFSENWVQVTFGSDGQLRFESYNENPTSFEITPIDSLSPLNEWVVNNNVDPEDYEIYAELLSGTLNQGTTNEWQSLSSSRMWEVFVPGLTVPETSTATIRFQIRNKDTLDIAATADITISANSGATGS